MSFQIANSEAFKLARDDGVGDYYHGQTIIYYDHLGHLVKTDHKNVLLWSNSGKYFDEKAYLTFKPRTVLYLDESHISSPEPIAVDAPTLKMEFDPVPESPLPPRESVKDVLIRSIQPSSKKQQTVFPKKAQNEANNDPIMKIILDETLEQAKLYEKQIMKKVLDETLEQTKLDEKQSDMQEFYAKKLTKKQPTLSQKKKKQFPPRRNPPRKAKKRRKTRKKTKKKGKRK